MTTKEINRRIDEIYIDTIKAYRMESSKAEADDWRKHFHAYPPAHLAKAIERWQATTEIDPYFNRPRGALFPRIADLLALLEKIGKEVTPPTKFKSCGRCNRDGWIFVEIRDSFGQPARGARRCECYREWARSRGVILAA